MEMLIPKKKRAISIALMLVLTTFAYSIGIVAADEPFVADAGGPYTFFECQSQLFYGASSGGPLSGVAEYRWDFMGDGVWTEWSSAIFIEYTWNDNYQGIITMEARKGGATASDTSEVIVFNLAPEITGIDYPLDPVYVGDPVNVILHFYDGDPRTHVWSLDSHYATFFWGDDTSTDYTVGGGILNITGSHVYVAPGYYEGFVMLKDEHGDEDSIYFFITVIEPSVENINVDAGPGGAIDEGSMFVSTGSFSTSKSGPFEVTITYGDGSWERFGASPGSFALSHQYLENGIYSILVTVHNDDYSAYGSDNSIVTVANVPPTIISVWGPPICPILINVSVALYATFTDPGIFDFHTAYIDWGDGTADVQDPLFPSVHDVSDSHKYESPGAYTITLIVYDDDGGYDTEIIDTYIVNYDLTTSFVTGGGWIIVNPGSYPANPSLGGRCNFGFVSKYKPGTNEVKGNTEFQFQVGDLNFHSDDYDYLEIDGYSAVYQGNGTINQEGHYGFLVTVIDGQIAGGGGVDKFRIKIWERSSEVNIIFDNGVLTALAGGQITIHEM